MVASYVFSITSITTGSITWPNIQVMAIYCDRKHLDSNVTVSTARNFFHSFVFHFYKKYTKYFSQK